MNEQQVLNTFITNFQDSPEIRKVYKKAARKTGNTLEIKKARGNFKDSQYWRSIHLEYPRDVNAFFKKADKLKRKHAKRLL